MATPDSKRRNEEMLRMAQEEEDQAMPRQPRTGFEAFRLAAMGQSGGRTIGGRKGSGGRMRFNRSVAGTRDPGKAEERLRQAYAGMSDGNRAGWEARANDRDIRSGREMDAAKEYDRQRMALMRPEVAAAPRATAASGQAPQSRQPGPYRDAYVPPADQPRMAITPPAPVAELPADAKSFDGRPLSASATAARGYDGSMDVKRNDGMTREDRKLREAPAAPGPMSPAALAAPIAATGGQAPTALTRPMMGGESKKFTAEDIAKYRENPEQWRRDRIGVEKAALDRQANESRSAAMASVKTVERPADLRTPPVAPKTPVADGTMTNVGGRGKRTEVQLTPGAAMARRMFAGFTGEARRENSAIARYANEAEDWMQRNEEFNVANRNVAATSPTPRPVAKTNRPSPARPKMFASR